VILGILETDSVDKHIRAQQGSYAEMFQRLFLSVDNSIEFRVYQVIEGEYPESVDECDAFLITGSKFSAYEDKAWIRRLREYIVELHRQKIKLMGICFGHQIIAQALGGRAERSKKGWGVGNVNSDIVHKESWMGGDARPFSLLVTHQDQVTRLPGGGRCIAGNSFCEYASFQIEKHILTFQGHPEFSTDYLMYLMDKRRDILGEERYNRALMSLNSDIDSLMIAQWMVDFCKQ